MKPRSVPLVATLTSLFALGAGCSSSALNNADGGHDGGADVPTVTVNCPDDSEPIDPTAIIDDMESPNFMTAMPGNRGGAWWAGGDDASKAQGAAIVPQDSFDAEAIPGGRCGSRYAVHVTGHGFMEWAVASVSFGYGSVDGGAPNVLPYDASFRTGIDFWARIGDTSTNQIRVEIPDKYSSDVGGILRQDRDRRSQQVLLRPLRHLSHRALDRVAALQNPLPRPQSGKLRHPATAHRHRRPLLDRLQLPQRRLRFLDRRLVLLLNQEPWEGSCDLPAMSSRGLSPRSLDAIIYSVVVSCRSGRC